MNASMNAPGQDSPRARRVTSAEFCLSWQEERDLDPSFGQFNLKKLTEFLPEEIQCPAFAIVTHDESGSPRPELSRTRYDTTHPGCPKDENGKPAKYKSPPGVGVVIYAPCPDSFKKFADAREKWIAEGEGKTLALAQLGYPVLGIGGCHMWHLKGQTTLHSQLAERIRKGDTVHVAIDGDWRTNPNVAEATELLLFAVRAVGAKPQLIHLPPDEGVDDFIARVKREGKDPHKELAALKRSSSVPSDIPITSYESIISRPAPEWIVKGVVPPGELTAIVGETSCGKTFLTMDLLLAVARKEPYWFGQRIKRHGLVVHITLEGTSLSNRVRAYQQHHKLAVPPPYVAIEVPINLREDGAALIKAIQHESAARGLPVVLIAVDTVNRALGGGDENSSQDMGAFLSGAEALKAAFPNCGILLVHHVGKDASRGARGHSSFSANVGAELNIVKDEKTGVRTISITKQRDANTDKVFNFKLKIIELGKDEDGELITACVVEPCERVSTEDASANHETIYGWIYSWWVSQYRSEPVSKNVLKEQYGLISSRKAKRDEVLDAWEWARNNGLLVDAAEKTNGKLFTLLPLKGKKY